MKLPRTFFEQKTLKVAKQLLGCFLIRQTGNKKIIAKIIETEAYCGPKDLANHASRGRTKRTEVMFGKAGHAYIYLIYGMYHCFNIVTEKENYPAAVLIRGVRIGKKEINGPGKVCRELKIDKNLNGMDIITSGQLWIEEAKKHRPKADQPMAEESKEAKIQSLPRVGVDYAGAWAKKKWRFIPHHFV